MILKEEQIFLGSFYAYHQAFTVAKSRYSNVSSCPNCLVGKRPTPAVTKVEPKLVVSFVTPPPKPEPVKPVSTIVEHVAKSVKNNESEIELIPEMKRRKVNINRIPTQHTTNNH